jgi:NADH-quinone oxidoreductase subunit N
LAQFTRWLALAMGLLLVLAASHRREHDAPEYIGSLLLSVVGLMLLACADELVLLFLALELISIPTYIVLYLGRHDAASQEATAKYFFLGVLASALLLYGLAFLYGTTGSTSLPAISAHLSECACVADGRAVLAGVALVLIFAGLGFKIAVAPFHFYAADVYQGTTNLNAGLLSVVPKIAGMVALVRLVVISMPGTEAYGWRIAMAVAALTMTYGNVLALWQDNLRRLLAYSSIAQAGTMLIGLAVGLASSGATRWDGVGGLLFYLCVYTIATLGTFAALVYLGREDHELSGVDELAGLGRTRPGIALLIAVFMFSLAGIPPLAGFWGKLTIFASALSVDAGDLRVWFIGLAVLGVLNAAVAAAYYLRVVAVMYFRSPLATPKPQGGLGAWTTAVVCAMLVVAIGLWSGPLLRASYRASPGPVINVCEGNPPTTTEAPKGAAACSLGREPQEDWQPTSAKPQRGDRDLGDGFMPPLRGFRGIVDPVLGADAPSYTLPTLRVYTLPPLRDEKINEHG